MLLTPFVSEKLFSHPFLFSYVTKKRFIPSNSSNGWIFYARPFHFLLFSFRLLTFLLFLSDSCIRKSRRFLHHELITLRAYLSEVKVERQYSSVGLISFFDDISIVFSFFLGRNDQQIHTIALLLLFFEPKKIRSNIYCLLLPPKKEKKGHSVLPIRIFYRFLSQIWKKTL